MRYISQTEGIETFAAIHFLLSYTCNLQCDHCFLYCSPSSKGTMTIDQITSVLSEASELGTVQAVYFEGGEPFLFYPIMIEGIKRASEMGFDTGIVTNGYWATTPEDAQLWLQPLQKLGLFSLSVSDDMLHYGESAGAIEANILTAADQLGIAMNTLRTEKPVAVYEESSTHDKGVPEISGGTRLRGRAVEKFAQGLPAGQHDCFVECPYEELEHPSRVHVDCYGNVQVCQGISMGNCWDTPLSRMVYNPSENPILGPLIRGGPLELAREHHITPQENIVDACHMCFATRLALLDRFPEYLAPKQVYGSV